MVSVFPLNSFCFPCGPGCNVGVIVRPAMSQNIELPCRILEILVGSPQTVNVVMMDFFVPVDCVDLCADISMCG